jgi:hypothetical protein
MLPRTTESARLSFTRMEIMLRFIQSGVDLNPLWFLASPHRRSGISN